MTVKNDEKILELKKLIEQEKKKYSEQKRFNPETCCIFDLDGKRINLNTISVIDRLNELLIYFNMFRLSAIDLGLKPDIYKVNNFSVTQWMNDINKRIEYVKYKNHLNELEEKEKLLDKLLSEDKKTELELQNIENMLKGL